MNPELAAPPPERFNFAAHLLALNARRHGKAAFIDDHRRLSYGELDAAVRRCANGLLALGLHREERVLLCMHDNCDWPVAFLGAIYAGLVPVAVNTLLPAADLAYMLAHSRAQVLITGSALWPTLSAAMAKGEHEVAHTLISDGGHPDAAVTEDAAPKASAQTAAGHVQAFGPWLQAQTPMAEAADTGRDEPAFWLYSSGSTGRPKGTVHSHANPYWTAQLYGLGVLGIREDDICFSAAKLFFAYGLGNALSFPLSAGATVLLMAERPTPPAVFARWRGEVAGAKPTLFFGAPTGYAGMLASPELPRREQVGLRLASSAGEALPAELGERFQAHFGVDIVDGIGSTEMLHIYLSNTPQRVRYGSTGWPVPGYAVALRADNGAEVPEGEPGDLYVAGPSAALMYWGNQAKSRETFQGPWTKSGDKYVRNNDGSYTYSGRGDDMLKVSGQYVSPFEVEATLAQHPAVLEAAVIGVTDAQNLTKAKAFVVLKPGAACEEAELQAFVKTRLAPFKYPRQIEFLAELPKTATGKIQRFKLRERERSAHAD
jgi:benzoate-CoA ligase